MSTLNPLLGAASAATAAAERALGDLIVELETEPPAFLSTVAMNFWSPYLPSGRLTGLAYPKAVDGTSLADEIDGERRLSQVHHRYLTLLGRNLSVNHLLVEVPHAEVKRIVVDGTSTVLDGPRIQPGETGSPLTLCLRMPLHSSEEEKEAPTDSSLQCFRTLVPATMYQKWLEWLADPAYERRFQGRLRDELLERRLAARRELPPAFADHLYEWLKKQWVWPHVGLSDFDDRWLARIQLTSLAAAIWGDIWVSHALSLGDGAKNRLRLQASCTVTGHVPKDAGEANKFAEDVSVFAGKCSTRLQTLLREQFRETATTLAALDCEPWEPGLSNVANEFSHELGGALIGADHEGEPVSFRGLLTPGLDSLQIGPTEVIVLHEIAQAEFEPLDRAQDHLRLWWDVWRAYFSSNDLFLARERIVLHFELVLADDGESMLPVPRHVVRVAGSIQKLLELLKGCPPGLLQIGFQTDEAKALHFRSSVIDGEPTVERGAQTKTEYRSAGNGGEKFAWGPTLRAQPDWGAVRDAIFEAIRLIRWNRKDDAFFKNAAASLNRTALMDNQLLQLADAIAEVRRLRRGCLLFIGPVYRQAENGTYWFMNQSGSRRAEITRLGLAFGVVSQIPETFSEDFRGRLADAAGMDGETIVFTALQDGPSPFAGYEVDRPAGYVETGRFVHLPPETPALLDLTKPKISPVYVNAWDAASQFLKAGYAPEIPGIICKTVSKLERTDLLSLGTRHRKAAMTTMCIDSITAVTCSASGKLRIWIGGVPVVEIAPQADLLLPSLSAPQSNREA